MPPTLLVDAPATGRRTHGLTPGQVEQVGRELDAVRDQVLAARGAVDATYIRRVIAVQRGLELGSRALLLVAGRRRPAWLLGTAALATAKVLDNMEIGHNVLHGQWDWMRDPRIHSTTWDWDHASPPAQWKRAHNEVHHRYTNVLGHDDDLGYGILRVDEAQEWRPRHLVQPLWNAVTACVFEYGIAMYDLDLGEHLRARRPLSREKRAEVRVALRKAGKQVAKDAVIHPLLSGRGWRATLAANAVAVLVRNVWSHAVIMCGHFPEGVSVFEQPGLDEHETRGEWYLRQMLGSANISGPTWLHILTGHLSHQVEHHCFPDLPSRRYPEIAPQVRAISERYGLPYHSRPLPQQVASAWHRVVRLSLPNGWLASTNRRNLGSQLRALTRVHPGVRESPERPLGS